ncbi:MAG TPA: peptidylprolyl isomerase [Steroidobacteraceae bacterium]|nr:peptidylprolyl isomerase [Steroidobacteraceae bacterium]HRX87920.1 peptidylprolyl isomerase [Steroidobacteraceae bacterium]
MLFSTRAVIFLLTALCLPTAAVLAQTRDLGSKGELLDRVAAVVNDGIVLQSELEDQVTLITERLRAQNQEMPPQNILRQQVLERLVMQELQMQRADRGGIRVSDEALNNALTEVAARNNIPLAQLPRALEAQGIDYAAYRDGIRKELTLQMLRQRDVIARINVSPRELQQYVDKQSKLPSDANEYNVSHILIAVPQAATPDQLDTAAKRSDEVYQRASQGEDFARLAVQFSNSQTALDGGTLGWRKGPELPTFLAELVAKMKAGDVSEPLRTPSGYHIIRLNEVRGNTQTIVEQVHARHILLKPTELLDDATVKLRLEAIRERLLKGEDFGAIAQATSEDPGSAVEGGDLGWTGPGSFVPEFEQVLESLAVDEISQPFRTQFGWHIVQLLGKREFDSTDEMRQQRAFAQLRESKADEETELWLRRLRDEAYVEYKL